MPGSPVPETRLLARWRRALGWLPVALVLAGVSNHYWLSSQHQISPWLSAGFGMFATTDMPSARHVHVIARLADGSEHEVALGEAYQEALERELAASAPIEQPPGSDTLARPRRTSNGPSTSTEARMVLTRS